MQAFILSNNGSDEERTIKNLDTSFQPPEKKNKPGCVRRTKYLDFFLALGIAVIVLLLIGLGVPSRMVHWARYHTSWFVASPAKIASDIQKLNSDPLLKNIISKPATGPLYVDPINPRYFADGSGKAILLTGSHTWSNFQDNGGSDPPPVFDYITYLNFLEAHHHNFFRLWTWEQSRWAAETSDENYWFHPMPYERTGPGTALDGKLKFDLTRFDQTYFDRMRQRIMVAGARGIYVSIMLFDGWSVGPGDPQYGAGKNNPWKGHPFNKNNNINGINGDPDGNNIGETQNLSIQSVTTLQEAYVRKVIDTVNDLDNVLYEICNEGGTVDWQYHLANYIQTYEVGKPKQHPVGITLISTNDAELYNSPADWVSIHNGGSLDPPVADGSKVILLDTDHICGVCGDRIWAWKAFINGHNPIFMDGYDGAGYGVGGVGFDFDDPQWVSLRKNLGYIRTFAERMNMEKMVPHGELSSTGYALANPSATGEYLVYLPTGGNVTVDLSATPGTLNFEWLNPSDGNTLSDLVTIGGTSQSFNAPFSDDAVLYIYYP